MTWWPKALRPSRLAIALLAVVANQAILAVIFRLPPPQPQFGDYHAQLVGDLSIADFIACLGLLVLRQWIAAAAALGYGAFLLWTLVTY